MRRVVITGLGIWSCLGNTLESVRDALYQGRSGIILDPVRKEMGFRSGLTARLELPDLKKELPRPLRVYMPEPAQYAYCATRDALRHAGIDQDYLDSHEVGLLYGNDSTADAVYKSISKIVEKKDTMLCGRNRLIRRHFRLLHPGRRAREGQPSLRPGPRRPRAGRRRCDRDPREL